MVHLTHIHKWRHPNTLSEAKEVLIKEGLTSDSTGRHQNEYQIPRPETPLKIRSILYYDRWSRLHGRKLTSLNLRLAVDLCKRQ